MCFLNERVYHFIISLSFSVCADDDDQQQQQKNQIKANRADVTMIALVGSGSDRKRRKLIWSAHADSVKALNE